LTATKILIVDDNVDAASSFADLLSISGRVVKIANNGWEALGIVANWPPHCVVLDIGMPLLDGFGTIDALRACPAYTRLPVIALTARSEREISEQLQHSGFSAYLQKPADFSGILAIIRTLTSNT